MTCILGTQMELVNKQGMHVLEQKILLNRLLRDRTQQTFSHLQISHTAQWIF